MEYLASSPTNMWLANFRYQEKGIANCCLLLLIYRWICSQTDFSTIRNVVTCQWKQGHRQSVLFRLASYVVSSKVIVPEYSFNTGTTLSGQLLSDWDTEGGCLRRVRGERKFYSSHTRLGKEWKWHPPSVLSQDSIYFCQAIRRLAQQQQGVPLGTLIFLHF